MKLTNLATFCTMIALTTGCASIAGDNNRSVKVNSTPEGAAIYVDNQQHGVTPAVIQLPSNIYGGKVITLRKAHYLEHSMTVNTQFQPVAILDILFWPTILIDAATGSLVKISPNDLNLHGKLQHA